MWWTRVHDIVANVLIAALVFLGDRNASCAENIPKMRAAAMQHAFGRQKKRGRETAPSVPLVAPAT